MGTRCWTAFDIDLKPGEHQLEGRFHRDGPSSGVLALAADGNDLGSVEISKVVRALGSTGMDLGCDRLSTVVDDYEGPFSFTGELRRVTFRIRSASDRRDIAVTTRSELAKE